MGSVQQTLAGIGLVNSGSGSPKVDMGQGSLMLEYGLASADPGVLVASMVSAGQIFSSTRAANEVIGYLDDNASDTELIRTTLFGDYNLDGKVNNADFFQFKKAFGTLLGQAAFNPLFDYDHNGIINNTDFFQFKRNFGKSV